MVRRRFAAPFVLTIAACSSGNGKPKEPTSDIGPTWRVSSSGGQCMAMAPMGKCPEGAMCNPPPPFDIKCPDGLTDGNSIQVTQIAEGSCAVLPDGCNAKACVGAAAPCPEKR